MYCSAGAAALAATLRASHPATMNAPRISSHGTLSIPRAIGNARPALNRNSSNATNPATARNRWVYVRRRNALRASTDSRITGIVAVCVAKGIKVSRKAAGDWVEHSAESGPGSGGRTRGTRLRPVRAALH